MPVVHPVFTSFMLRASQLRGLCYRTETLGSVYQVRDLKKILRAMEPLQFVRAQGGLPGTSNKRKQCLINVILHFFYQDFPFCHQPRQEAVTELSALCSPQRAPSRTTPAQQTPATNTSRCHSRRNATPTVRAAAASASIAAASASNSAAPTSRSFSAQQQRFHARMTAVQHYQQRLIPQMAAASQRHAVAATTTATAAASASTTPSSGSRSSVEQETSEDDEYDNSNNDNNNKDATPNPSSDQKTGELDPEQPNNEREKALLQTMLAMGFTDRSEILSSIRRLTNNKAAENNNTNANPNPSPPTPDDIMCDIIHQREEAEEARKMDEARILSEQARKEESKRRRLTLHQEAVRQKQQASWSAWSTNFFPNSWILPLTREALERRLHVCAPGESSSSSSSSVKKRFVELLDLEKNAHKWYKGNLPRGYFISVVVPALLNTSTVTSLERVLQHQMDILQTHMYQLSSQQGGVPAIFLQAQDQKQRDHQNDSGEDDDDDEVVVVVGVDNAAAGKENSSPVVKSQAEVIDLLD